MHPRGWDAGEGVGWDRKQVGVSAGQRGQVFAIKRDKLLKSACLYSRNAFQNSPFEEDFIHWSPPFLGQSCALQDANGLLLLGRMCVLLWKNLHISE